MRVLLRSDIAIAVLLAVELSRSVKLTVSRLFKALAFPIGKYAESRLVGSGSPGPRTVPRSWPCTRVVVVGQPSRARYKRHSEKGPPWGRGVSPREMEVAMSMIRRSADGGIEAFKCRTCDAWHEGPIDSLGSDVPEFVWGMSDEERTKYVTLSSDQCVHTRDGRTDYLIRGCLEIPALDGPGPFSFGVWTTLSEANFVRATDLWETPGRESEPPSFGWLCTRLPSYPDTMFLKARIQTRPVGERPLVTVLEPVDHPLVVEQREGITVERWVEVVEAALH